MPQLGESVAEGTIGKWLKQPGDTVAKYEPLLEVITDKVNAEVPSPFAGILREILVEEGATVPNNAEIAVIETDDEAPPAARASSRPSRPPRATLRAGAPTAAPARATPGAAAAGRRPPGRAPGPAPRPQPPPWPPDRSRQRRAQPGRDGRTAAPTAPAATDGARPMRRRARMTPAVRRLLREHGLTAR